MTAIESMTIVLRRLQGIQADCIDENGFLKPYCKYKYRIATDRAKIFKEAIDFMKELYENKESPA